MFLFGAVLSGYFPFDSFAIIVCYGERGTWALWCAQAGQARNYFVELVLSFHLHMGSQDRTQAFAAGSLLKVLVTVPSAAMKHCDQKPLRECMAPIDSCI